MVSVVSMVTVPGNFRTDGIGLAVNLVVVNLSCAEVTVGAQHTDRSGGIAIPNRAPSTPANVINLSSDPVTLHT